MQSFNVEILGERFSVISGENLSATEEMREENNVCILPSRNADFRLEAFRKDGLLYDNYYAPAIAATAFFVYKRGLPLCEYSFEVPGKNIETIYTGDGVFCINNIKCKYLCSKSVELRGCDVDYRDILLSGLYRLIGAKGCEFFDGSVLSSLATVGAPIPRAVILSCLEGDRILTKVSSQYSEYQVSHLSQFILASYNEYISSGRMNKSFSSALGNAETEIINNEVSMKIKI